MDKIKNILGEECSIILKDNFILDKSKVDVESNNLFSPNSFMENRLNWLISIKYVPVKKNRNYTFVFKLFSKDTVLALFLFSGGQAVIFGLQIATFILLLPYSYNRKDVTDNLALLGFFKFQFFFDVAKPFVLAKTVSKFSWLSLQSHLPLQTSRHWIKIIICLALYFIGEFFIAFKVVFDTFQVSPFPKEIWTLVIFIHPC